MDRGGTSQTTADNGKMAKKKSRPYLWNSEPDATQRGELSSDLKNRWDRPSESSFSEPSRLRRERLRRRRRAHDPVLVGIAGLLVVLAVLIGFLATRAQHHHDFSPGESNETSKTEHTQRAK